TGAVVVRPIYSILLVIVAMTVAAAVCETLCAGDATTDKSKAPAEAPSFQKDIRPLLQAKCARCHNEKARKAELDLSKPSGILKGGESGPVIVPGKPDKS